MARPVTELEMMFADQALREAVAKYEALTRRAPKDQLLDCAKSLAMSLRKGTRVAKKFPKVELRRADAKRLRGSAEENFMRGTPMAWFVKDDIRGGWLTRKNAPKRVKLWLWYNGLWPKGANKSPVSYSFDWPSDKIRWIHRRKYWGAARFVWFKALAELNQWVHGAAPTPDTVENPDAHMVAHHVASAQMSQAEGKITMRSVLRYATQALRQPLNYYKVKAARGIEGRIEHVLKKDAAKCGLKVAS